MNKNQDDTNGMIAALGGAVAILARVFGKEDPEKIAEFERELETLKSNSTMTPGMKLILGQILAVLDSNTDNTPDMNSKRLAQVIPLRPEQTE